MRFLTLVVLLAASIAAAPIAAGYAQIPLNKPDPRIASGIPRKIYVDRVSAIADDETGYTISRFVPLK